MNVTYRKYREALQYLVGSCSSRIFSDGWILTIDSSRVDISFICHTNTSKNGKTIRSATIKIFDIHPMTKIPQIDWAYDEKTADEISVKTKEFLPA